MAIIAEARRQLREAEQMPQKIRRTHSVDTSTCVLLTDGLFGWRFDLVSTAAYIAEAWRHPGSCAGGGEVKVFNVLLVCQ